MSKNTKIQSYLDSQLLKIQNNTYQQALLAQQKSYQSDKLQQRLNSIQKKLNMLKNMDYSQFKTAEKQKQKKHSKILFKVEPIEYASSTKKKITKPEVHEKEKGTQFTPVKQLKGVSKAISERNFKTNPNSEVKLHPTSKKYESAKKSTKTIDKIYQQGIPRNKIYSTSKKLNFNKFSSDRLHTDTQYGKQLNKTQQKNLVDLKKSVNKCLITQSKIQSRMGQLQNYQKSYQKLKRLFEKCQKLRKKIK